MIKIHKCLRCEHEWPSRLERLPKQCPACRSPYWARKKVKMSGPRRPLARIVVNGSNQSHQPRVNHEKQTLAIDNLRKRLQSPRLSSPQTLATYLSTARIFMEWLPHDPPVTDVDFREFFTNRRENNISERTLRKEFFHVKKLAEANQWSWPFIKEEAPVSKTKPFAPSHSIADIEKIIAARDLLTKGERFFLACSTTWGCRREELSRIGKRDYNNEIITLHIAKRNVDFEHLIPEVFKPIFEAYHPAHLSPTALTYVYYSICKKAGVPHLQGWGWHSFRRMVFTALAEALVANGLQESWAANFMAWSPQSIGRTFSGSAMAGVYTHSSEATSDPWRQEKLILAVHPFVRCWLTPTVKHEPTFK